MDRRLKMNWNWRRWSVGFSFAISYSEPRAYAFGVSIGPFLIKAMTHPKRFSYVTDKLKAENARYRKALHEIVEEAGDISEPPAHLQMCQSIARRALKGGE